MNAVSIMVIRALILKIVGSNRRSLRSANPTSAHCIMGKVILPRDIAREIKNWGLWLQLNTKR